MPNEKKSLHLALPRLDVALRQIDLCLSGSGIATSYGPTRSWHGNEMYIGFYSPGRGRECEEGLEAGVGKEDWDRDHH